MTSGVWTAMTDAISQRGRDAAGYYRATRIGLGHRRLSILDLAPGDQPLANEDAHIIAGQRAGTHSGAAPVASLAEAV